jgi:3-oxoacyl-[acyl-carrier-protein] synthase-3
MIIDFQSSGFQVGESQISVETILSGTNRDYQRTLARAGFERVFRTHGSEEEFFKSFLSASFRADPGDTVILVNQSSGYVIPGLAPRIFAAMPGAETMNFVEISDGCTGFVRALLLAESLLESAMSPAVTIICGEVYSRYISDDSSSAPIFSDAISQIRLVAGRGFRTRSSALLNSLGDFSAISLGENHTGLAFEMEGAKVLNWVSRNARRISNDLTVGHSFSLQDVDLWFFHQGSKVVVESVANSLGLTGDDYFWASSLGNTASSSIPIGLIRASNRVVESHSIGLLAFGIGLTMIGVVLEAET